MDLKNKYIKIKNEEHFYKVIKFLEDNNWITTKSKDYKKENARVLGDIYGIYILLYQNKKFNICNHDGGYTEFILPEPELSLKEKLINLFKHINTVIKINDKQEYIKYCTLLDKLGEFKWFSGCTYLHRSFEDSLNPGISALKLKGQYLHRPNNGTGVSLIREQDKLIEFKDILNNI